jgi:hypothetical protein
MQLSLLQIFLENYKESLQKSPPIGLFKWESQQIWQDNFNLETDNPVEMFDRSLENSTSRRLWHREQFFPKNVLLEFWKQDSMTLRAAFSDLFDETKLPENRLSRFVFACDIMLADYRSTRPNTRQSEHFHQDLELATLYLAFQFPADYAPYSFPIFQKTMQNLASRDVPQFGDLARWFKLTKTMHQFIEKDKELLAVFDKWRNPKIHFSGKSLLIVDDFCRFVCQ